MLDGLFAVIVIVAVVRTPHSVPLLDVFVELQQAESRLITKYKKVICNNPLLQSEEI